MEDANSTAANQTCTVCGTVGLSDGGDGFFYCAECGAQAEDIMDMGLADEDFVADKGIGRDAQAALYSARHSRHIPVKVEPLSQIPMSQSFYETLSQAIAAPVEPKDHLGPTEPSDFGWDLGNGLSLKDYYNNVRISYVYGLQLMINFQCEALVEKFNVNPSVCGISGSIWLRYLRSTRVFDDGWADEVQLESQSESQGYNKMYTKKTGGKFEPRNNFNQRMVMLWYRALRKTIPLSSSLAITYLSCHIAREPVLPTDIQRWTLEGKLPYLAAFVEIEKTIKSTRECPLSASSMFRPSQAVPLQKLESLAANIAQIVGLTLPPVNFYAIASRYLRQLSLPVEKILPYACCIHDWSMPPGLWLSTCEWRLPTRVCVMSILIVAVRSIYKLNGFGKWEASLSDAVDSSCTDKLVGSLDSPSDSEANTEAGFNSQDSDEIVNDRSSIHKLEHEASHILRNLQKRCGDISEELEYSKDLETYLQHCKDVVFGGLMPSFEDFVEEKMIKRFWDFYFNNKKGSEAREGVHISTKQRGQMENDDFDNLASISRSYEEDNEESMRSLDDIDNHAPSNSQGQEDSATSVVTKPSEESREMCIRLMKLHMEENRFYYIPPRKHIKRLDYLHYVRKRDDGSLTYAAHADYYILLHACAREAQVDVRIMHQGVMSLEKRLAWIEQRVDGCLRETAT